MGTKVLATFVVIFSFFALSAVVQAGGGDVDTGRKIGEIVCTFVYLIEFLAVGLASLLIMFAGVKYLVAGDDPHARSSAKRWIANVFVSIIIIFTAIPIINFSTRGLTGQYTCEMVPGEKMITGASAGQNARENEEESQTGALVTEEDIVYAQLLGNGPVDRGTSDGSPDGRKGTARPAENKGGTYSMPDFLVIAFFLLGISMAFTVGVTAYKLRGYLKR